MSAIGKTLKFTGGLLAGLGIGAVTALVLAPQSGQLTMEQLQTRVDEVLAAGRRAQRQTEDELYSRWEAELAKADQPASGSSEQDSTNKALADARKAAEEAEKREEAKRKEAERHIGKARDELDKARKAI